MPYRESILPLLADIVEHSVDAIISVSFDGVIESWNAGAQHIFGCTEAGAIGRPIAIFVPFEFRSKWEISVRRLKEGALFDRFETAHVTELGQTINLWTISFLKDSAGGLAGVCAVGRDVTQVRKLEAALHAIEQRFRFATQAGRMFSYEWNVVTDELIRDQEAAEILGLTGNVTHTTGQEVMASIHPDDRLRIVDTIAGLSRDNPVYRVTMRILRPDGSVIWLERTGRGFFSAEGKLLRLVGMAVDVTDRMRSEEALRRSEAELLEAQRLAHVGSWHWDLETDTFNWSGELYRIAGRDPGQSTPTYQEHAQLFSGESWGRLKSAVEEALRTGTPYELDLRMRRPDGKDRWVRARGEVQRNLAGRLVALHGTIQDITERRLAEQTLLESEEKFRSVFRDAGVGIVLVSPEKRFLAVNSAFGEYLGYTEQELLNEPLESLVHADDWPLVSRALDNVLTTGQNLHKLENRCIHKSGRILWTEDSASVIRGPNGEAKYFVVEAVDVTERKLAAEALSGLNRRLVQGQEQERTRIARELHDDISQSLTVLIIRLQEMRKTALVSPTELAARIDALINHAAEISGNVRSLSHGLHTSKIEYLGIVKAMASYCKEYAAHHSVEIRFSHDGVRSDTPAEISLCLFRVLQEALQNAVKYSGVRDFEVRLSGTTGEIALRVSDAGVGFDPEAAMKQPGLGLISMRERLRMVEGTFSITSKPDEGTTVHAHAPLISKLKAGTSG